MKKALLITALILAACAPKHHRCYFVNCDGELSDLAKNKHIGTYGFQDGHTWGRCKPGQGFCVDENNNAIPCYTEKL